MVLDQLLVTYILDSVSGIAIVIQIYLQVLRVIFSKPSSYCDPGPPFTRLQLILLVVTRLGGWLGRSIESLCDPIKLFAGSMIVTIGRSVVPLVN